MTAALAAVTLAAGVLLLPVVYAGIFDAEKTVYEEEAPAEELFQRPLHPYTRALLSAIPVPDIHTKKEEIILEGELPSPLDPPKGCLFSTRCPHAADRCRAEAPRLTELQDPDGAVRSVACFLHQERN